MTMKYYERLPRRIRSGECQFLYSDGHKCIQPAVVEDTYTGDYEIYRHPIDGEDATWMVIRLCRKHWQMIAGPVEFKKLFPGG